MVVTATEFQTNISKYLELVVQEDIFITRDGKTIAKMVNPQGSAVDALRGLLKGAPETITPSAAREERLTKYEDTL